MNTGWMAARIVAATAMCMGAVLAHAAGVEAGSAANLRARYVELRDQLEHNQFSKPLHLDSSEVQDGVRGAIYALLDHPFATAAAALNGADNWCEILSLHINTKYCRAAKGGQGSILSVSIGTKHMQRLDQAYRLVLAHRVAEQDENYLQVRLDADEGPMGTHDYRILLEAVPVDGGKTFLHLSYSYAFGMAGRLAMQAYLGTTGRNKVGFTIARKKADGRPVHIGGTRGVVERNTMRYYLAIEVFLGALSTPPQARHEKRLRDWFAAVERYPLQLHEMDLGEYLDMKRREYLRQRAGGPPRHAMLGVAA